MFRFIKIHWFGLIMLILAFIYLAVFLLVLFSPRQDSQNRGFIPCTKEMAAEIFACQENKAWCMAKAVVKNGYCDTKVVFSGFAKWISGKQTTPWENYLFVPDVNGAENQTDIDPELQQFYEQNRDLDIQMNQLERQRLELEKRLESLEHNPKLPQKDSNTMEKTRNEATK